jgi:hypothetical protein
MKTLLLALLLIPAVAPAQIAKSRVRETAGLRRFSFPVRVSWKRPAECGSAATAGERQAYSRAVQLSR